VRPYLLIDAGWTLVFPDCALIREILRDHGYSLSEERLERAMARVVYAYDESLARGRRVWHTKGFFEEVLEQAGVEALHLSPIAARLEALNAEHSLWSTTRPWVPETLARLDAQGYRMSVISNADGRVAQEFAQLGLDGHFEAIFDSHLVGYAKPDARLFQHAMKELGLQSEDCTYVGDMYFVDVLGANRAGIAGVQVDPFGLYSEWPGIRIPTVASLPDFLRPDLDWQAEAFFPLRDVA
jgi:HAD superfamily hydrolase (TIGR01662 family)